MTRKMIVVVNGYARSGKDTVVSFLMGLCSERDVHAASFSSIDPVFSMLVKAGIRMNRHRLSDADRDLLAEVGTAVEKHSFFRTEKVVRRAYYLGRDAEAAGEDAILFVFMREPENIERVRARAASEGFEFRTLLVERPNVRRVTSNAADMAVEGMKYDLKIVNDGSLDDLQDRCVHLIHEILEVETV